MRRAERFTAWWTFAGAGKAAPKGMCLMMPADLVKRVVEACGKWQRESWAVRLMGERRARGRFETRGIVQRGSPLEEAREERPKVLQGTPPITGGHGLGHHGRPLCRPRSV